MKACLFTLLVFLFSHTSWAGLVDELSIVRADGSTLSAYFQRPEKIKSFPIIVVLQGSDCRSIYNSAISGAKPFLALGIARLDLEKYGLNKNSTTCTQEYLDHNATDQRVQDYLRAFQFIRETVPEWNGQFILLGGSEGAIIAPSVAAMTPEVKKLVLLAAGGGITMRENLLMRQEIELKSRGKSQVEIDAELKIANAQMDAMIASPSTSKTWGGPTNTYRWWASILDILPIADMLEMSIPIYLAHGDTDAAFLVESSRRSKSVFVAAGKSNLTYQEYPGLDHHWLNAKGQSHQAKVIQDLISWIQKTP
jgi:alpha-beta hydrolase superfamily lysophospholipase